MMRGKYSKLMLAVFMLLGLVVAATTSVDAACNKVRLPKGSTGCTAKKCCDPATSYCGAGKVCLPLYRVLFIGNSLTARNNLVNMFTKISNNSGNKVLAVAATAGAATFQTHTNSYATLNLLMSRAWDAVVLQEQSERLSLEDNRYEMQSVFPFAAQLRNLAMQSNPNVQIFLYQTNAYLGGNPGRMWNYQDSYIDMQSRITRGYERLRNYLGGNTIVVPAGQAFANYYQLLDAKNKKPAAYLNMFQDHVHPTARATYLIACAFYSKIFGKPTSTIKWKPGGMGAVVVREVRQSAALVLNTQGLARMASGIQGASVSEIAEDDSEEEEEESEESTEYESGEEEDDEAFPASDATSIQVEGDLKAPEALQDATEAQSEIEAAGEPKPRKGLRG